MRLGHVFIASNLQTGLLERGRTSESATGCMTHPLIVDESGVGVAPQPCVTLPTARIRMEKEKSLDQ